MNFIITIYRISLFSSTTPKQKYNRKIYCLTNKINTFIKASYLCENIKAKQGLLSI